MFNVRVLLAIWAPVAIFLAGCENAGPPDGFPSAQTREDRIFLEEDRRVAGRLSIGASTSRSSEDDPLANALMCDLSLAAVTDKLREVQGIENNVVKVMQQARSIYATRARSAALDANMSEEELSTQISQLQQGMRSDSERGQIAISCLRDLQRREI